MNDAIEAMVKNYGPIRDSRDRENALKEVVQLVTLLGLHRGGLFEVAAFYGGTALRLLYGLNRFSEDMDFCLESPDPDFKLSTYFDAIGGELKRFGFDAQLTEKKTGPDAVIESAFVKQDTLSGLLTIGAENKRTQKGKLVKVRLEVDKANPDGADYCSKLVKLPTPFMVKTLTGESLFAGKVHAILARSYANRVKGRDYYDFSYYLSHGTSVNLRYLEAKLRDSGHLNTSQPLTISDLKLMLVERFRSVDFRKARDDVRPFLKTADRTDLESWQADLFIAMVETLTAANE